VRIAPRPLSTAIRSLTAALAPATTLARVQEVWERTTGPAIAAAAKPTAERDGVLTVTCEAAVWAQELDLMASELIPTLNAALASLDPKLGEEALRELRCRTG
jgi:predicted nucleic acid-binding Zn ribbon protein